MDRNSTEGQYYQESIDKRYQTPESFRTGRLIADDDDRSPPITPPSAYERRKQEAESSERPDGADSQLKDFNMASNPYLDPGYAKPYQLSQNRYREQVFGNSRPHLMEHNMKPERLQLEQMNREQRQEEYDRSPRRQPADYYEQRTYRSGRPDLGYEQDLYVPLTDGTIQTNDHTIGFSEDVAYPQEPLRRRRAEMDYMQPPSIGYDSQRGTQSNPKYEQHHGTQTNPKLDVSLEDGCGPHPGWLVLMRFNKDSADQVQRALYMCQKHIESDGGRIMGMAKSYGIKIREGGDNWVTFGKLRHQGGGVWGPQESPMPEQTSYCVLAIYYPSLSRAKQWWDRDTCFKQKDFPRPNGSDCIALPLSSSVDTAFNKSLVMTMYPKISNAEYFRDNFSVRTEDMMMKRFRASPYVVKTTYVPTDDPRHRVAHTLRGWWLARNSIVTLSMFDTLQEANRYFTDPEYMEAKKYQDKVSAPTTVILDLEDWKPEVPRYGRY